MANSHGQPGQNGHPRLCDSAGTMERAPRHGQAVRPPEKEKNRTAAVGLRVLALAPCWKVRTGQPLILNMYTTDSPRPAPPPPSPPQLIQRQPFRCTGQKAPIRLDPSFSRTASTPSGHLVSAPCTRGPASDPSHHQYPH